eukprot:CAMPEP_0182900412 /NCGR_PEP_ID=MMETSP0034_2-20130328/28830_1 /TAXON_ID=156128 /ORGANISM="Nephroselmis pyriformis, Strain CCMP717" /LENGTH=54 /DNA_ID=CAMNT_0025034621 /DNA_START=1 /DNA_END=165 /DNA_ORIENTATION=-
MGGSSSCQHPAAEEGGGARAGCFVAWLWTGGGAVASEWCIGLSTRQDRLFGSGL